MVWQGEAEIICGQVIEPLHEGESCAEEEHWFMGFFRIAQGFEEGSSVENPIVLRAEATEETRPSRAEVASNGVKHVDQRRTRCFFGWWSQGKEPAFDGGSFEVVKQVGTEPGKQGRLVKVEGIRV